MNNDLEEARFGRRDVFNTEIIEESDARTRIVTTEPDSVPKIEGPRLVRLRRGTRLEITYGEVPFVCSRYDTVTGDELPRLSRVTWALLALRRS